MERRNENANIWDENANILNVHREMMEYVKICNENMNIWNDGMKKANSIYGISVSIH